MCDMVGRGVCISRGRCWRIGRFCSKTEIITKFSVACSLSCCTCDD